jgi:hypothetical protein
MKKFKKGEYYVVLKDNDDKNNWTNYIFEQSIDSNMLDPVKKKNGTLNKNDQSFNGNYNDNSDWYRLATDEEIQHYIKINKPYDITTLEFINVKQNYTVLLNKIKFINNYENTKIT